jgi:hypothetical protein
MVGSQIANLTPGPSFAHNLGDRCPNAQCEGIFDIYASRTFQWHQEHPNARCFGSCCWALNIQKSRRTPNPQLFQVLGFTPTLGQVRVATDRVLQVASLFEKVASTIHQIYHAQWLENGFNIEKLLNHILQNVPNFWIYKTMKNLF